MEGIKEDKEQKEETIEGEGDEEEVMGLENDTRLEDQGKANTTESSKEAEEVKE